MTQRESSNHEIAVTQENSVVPLRSGPHILDTQLQRDPPQPFITLGRDEEIDLAGEELCPMRRASEGDAGKSETALPDRELEVTGATGGDLLGPGVAKQEEGLGIAGAKGTEALEIGDQRQGEFFDQNFTIIKKKRNEIIDSQNSGGGDLEGGGKSCDAAGGDGEPGGKGVAAVAVEIGGAGLQDLIKVKTADRTRRAFAALAIQGNQHRRTMIALDEAAGDDADDAGMPAGSGEDEGIFAPLPFFHLSDRFGEDLLFHPLPLAVKTVEQAGQLLGPRPITGEQKLDAEVGILQAAGGIETGGETESDIATGDLTDTSHSSESLQARTPPLIDDAETDTGQDAIDAAQGDDIGNRPQGDEIETVAEIGLGLGREGTAAAQAAAQGDQEHKGDADAGELFVGIE